MNSNLTQEEKNLFVMHAIQIFEAERQHPLHDGESLPYSEAELRAIQRMVAYIERHIIARPTRFKSFVSFRKNRPYFRDQVQFYHDLKKDYLEEKRFPEPDFLMTPRLGYEYVVIAKRDWIVPSDDRDIYSLFLAFKIRNLPIQQLPSLLEYECSQFPVDFKKFMEVFLIEWNSVLSNEQSSVIKNWLGIELLEKKTISTKKKNSIMQGTYTQAQIVLIIYYAFKYFGFEIRRNTDIAPVAKFIHLLVGEQFSVASNSEYYKKLLKAPNLKKDSKLVEDLEIVKQLFQNVKLNEVAEMIDNEIITARKERKNKEKE